MVNGGRGSRRTKINSYGNNTKINRVAGKLGWNSLLLNDSYESE